jgi:hypothetical protein
VETLDAVEEPGAALFNGRDRCLKLSQDTCEIALSGMMDSLLAGRSFRPGVGLPRSLPSLAILVRR